MKIKEYFELELVDDIETQSEFIEYVADIDEISIESVKELDYSKEEWNQCRDYFLDVGDY